MNSEEQEQFRKEFASIVYLNSCIISSGVWLKQLHAYDKNDSHKNAIIKKLDERKELKSELAIKLKGKSYEEWKTFSKRLTILNGRVRRAIVQQEKSQAEIDKLNF